MELYCIDHGTMEKAQALFDTVKLIHPDGTPDERAVQIGFIHEWGIWTDHGFDLDWCEFGMGWATTPPPDNFPVDSEDWWYNTELYCPEPGVEEMDIINTNADILLADLEVK